MDRLPETEKRNNFGMKCMKYMLFLINVIYLIISFLMISGATTLKVIFGEYYFILWYTSTVDSLTSLYIATGCFLLVLSVFGIIAAVKESTLMTNIYGLILALIFILQMAAAITGFTLITQSSGIVRESLQYLMKRASGMSYSPYYSSHYGGNDDGTMDWVQKTFECCGNAGPSDWDGLGKYGGTTERPWGMYDEYKTTTESVTERPLGVRMPQSCCLPDSSYDKINFICNNYFTRGCHGPLYTIVSESVMMIGSSALIIGVVQILGVICAFIFARTIRRSKTDRDIQKWTVNESMSFNRAAYVDQLATSEIHTDEIKHI
jgi:CD63 antigen